MAFPLKGDFMDPAQVYVRIGYFITNIKKSLRNVIGVRFLKKWEYIEKEDIIPVDETMLQEILRIQAEAFENKNQEHIIKYSKNLRKIFYVIKNQDKIAGYCAYYLKPELSFKGLRIKSVVYSIAIDEEFRGKGYGRKLLEESIKEMKLNGIYSILLYVNVNNISAIKLYEKMGFKIVKKTEGICGVKEKCYVMELNLG